MHYTWEIMEIKPNEVHHQSVFHFFACKIVGINWNRLKSLNPRFLAIRWTDPRASLAKKLNPLINSCSLEILGIFLIWSQNSFYLKRSEIHKLHKKYENHM